MVYLNWVLVVDGMERNTIAHGAFTLLEREVDLLSNSKDLKNQTHSILGHGYGLMVGVNGNKSDNH